MFVPIRPRDRRILLLELLFMWDIFRGAGRGGCPNDGGLRRLSRLGGGVGQEVQHATGALGAALLVDGAEGDHPCLVPTLGDPGETSGLQIDRIPPTRPSWWRRQYRELKKLRFLTPSKCPIDSMDH